jgi:drug/metabolite transporter (DMT)-like permease
MDQHTNTLSPFHAVEETPLAAPIGTGGLDPAIRGTLYCIAAALLYTGANICLRVLAVRGDPIWVVFLKESMAVLIVGPWLVYQAFRGQRVLPQRHVLVVLVLVGLATELIGNIGTLWAMGIIGLAVNIPVVVGLTLISAALMGRLVLGERISPRSVLAVALLVVAVVLLSLNAGRANQSIAAKASVASGPYWVALAVLVTCVAGIVFGALSITIRWSMTRGLSPLVLVVAITSMGTLTLGPLSYGRLGWSGMAATPGADVAVAVLCGLLNLAAFTAISKGLQQTTVVHANVVNASQTAMAAVAGMLLFAEPLSGVLVGGVLLTMAGVVLIDRPVRAT